ncbi:MAG: hypothetical protein RLZZ293_581 [Pseudomonadota bacterium]|jgi:uncharacterized protein HemX
MNQTQPIENNSTNQISLAKSNPVKSNSKLAIYLAGLSLSCSVYLAYQGIWGPSGLQQQLIINRSYQQQLAQLTQDNLKLAQQLNQLQQQQQQLTKRINQLDPSDFTLLVVQLTKLISGANQSILLFHDYLGAEQQLSLAQNLIHHQQVNDPRFMALKINLAKDILMLQQNLPNDDTLLLVKLNQVSSEFKQLNLSYSSPHSTKNSDYPTSTWWQTLLKSMHNYLVNLVTIEKITSQQDLNSQANNLVNSNELTQLALVLLQAKEAVINHDPAKWQTSLMWLIQLSKSYPPSAQQLTLINHLNDLQQQSVSINLVNLNNSLAELAKLQTIKP